ncbi:site-specific integrase [Clostridium gasigenes]|uniref:site-specific integrase n=1 Tax=Clostridium gasigenes TaxID=94869 RepID=UPI001627B4BF|nr:site-specific integrase [Clostridium gasigenes]MBB6622071.1 site-specific integrase [Clostridium gasigenes]
MEYNITYRQKDKGWQFIISYKVNGIWKQKSKQGFKTKKDCKSHSEILLSEFKNNLELNIEEGSEFLTIGQLKKEYLSHIETHREYNTLLNYQQSLNYFDIDNIEVVKLRLHDVQKCTNGLANKYSLSTIQRRTTIFKCMLNFAHRQYNLPIPSMANLTLPTSNKEPISKRALNKDEEIKLLDTYFTKGNDYYLVVLLALKIGLRVGEIMGLTWYDIDFSNSILKVNKQWKINKLTKKWGFGELKSKNSYRDVPIPTNTLKELQRIKSSLEDGKIVTLNFNDSRLIGSTSTQSISVNLDKQLQRNFKVCIHELRHTYATNLISNGVDFKTAAKLLGHDIEQTMKTYAHVTDDMMKKTADLISRIF